MPDLMAEEPNPPDPAFSEGVLRWMDSEDISEPRAAVLHAIELDPETGPEVLDAIARIREAGTPPSGTPEADWLGRLSRWFTEAD